MSRRKQIALTTLVPCQRLHIITFYQARKKKSKQREKFRFRAARAPESVCKGKQLLPSTETKHMKQFIHLKSTIIPWVRGPIRYSPLGGILLLVPLLFACFALSQTVEAANPAPATPATNASGGSIDGLQSFSNTDLLRPAPTIITFDAPGSGTGPGQGTITFAINPAGTISGRYADSGTAIHAFVRTRDGAIITFDAPGAGTGPRQGTRPFSINPAGATAGYYNDASNVFHGFLRTRHGAITTFDIAGAGTGPGQGTFAGTINPQQGTAGA